MERLLQGSFETTRADNMDMDFNDVFGGPPRRFSIQEVRKRNSFNDQMESEEDSEAVVPRSSWSGLTEKPVFGADRRCSQQGNEFYDDIFGGDEAYSSPRRMDMEAYGSRVLSPAWPLPPKAESFSTSLPAQFSLPAKLTKTTEYPAFGSGNRSPYHSKDGTSNGSLSRFSSQSRQRENGSQMIFRQTSLSREASLSGDERSSGEKDSEEPQFHFSIYKWAGKGVPLLTPLMRGKNSNKPKENNSRLERCMSSNARVQCDEPDGKLNVSIDTKPDSWKIGNKKQEKQNGNDYKELDFVATEAVPELKNLNNAKNKVVPEGPKSGARVEGEEETRSKIKAEFRNGIQNEGLSKKETESKPQSVLPNDVHQGQGTLSAGNGEINQVAREKNARTDDSNARFNETMKKSEVKKREVEAKMNGKKSGITKNRVEVQDNLPSNPEEKSTKVGVKGKVQEFVKIFNKQETTSVSKGETRSQSSRWRGGNFNAVEKETGDSTRQTIEEVQIPSMNKTAADAFQRVEQILNTKEKTNKHSYKKPSIHQTTTHPADQNSASSFSEPIRNGLRRSVGSADDLFHGSFVVEELYEDESKPLQKSGESHDMKASDAKIQQWSQGRKGNIRSLLSTLQLVLWPESGWKAVPLVELIEGSAVKRAYQKALLYLHPDKLQQKGAASHQKYIAEKVFDILQEAWDHFNSLGGI